MLRNISLKAKLGLMALFSIIGMLALSSILFLSLHEMSSIGGLRVLVGEIKVNMLTLRRNEKDFLARNDLKYLEEFLGNHNLIQKNLLSLETELSNRRVDAALVGCLKTVLGAYKEKFLALVTSQKKIGLHPEDALYGSVRKAVHQVEAIFDELKLDRLGKELLMLRRHEKDFMLRSELTYVGKFDKGIALLRDNLGRAGLDKQARWRILAALETYEKDFRALVTAREEMGLNIEAGLLGEMRRIIHQSEDALDKLTTITLGIANDRRSGIEMESAVITATMLMGIILLILILLP